MNVGENKVVSMTYVLREGGQNGPILQEVEKDRPFVYLFGSGGLLPAFKSNLEGLAESESFSFLMEKMEAYGDPKPENVIDLDKEIFKVDGVLDESLLVVGQVVPMEDEDGYPLTGTIVDVKDDTVTVDFNHPLAGLDLHFSGQILEVRDATPEELEHGHAHSAEHNHE